MYFTTKLQKYLICRQEDLCYFIFSKNFKSKRDGKYPSGVKQVTTIMTKKILLANYSRSWTLQAIRNASECVSRKKWI